MVEPVASVGLRTVEEVEHLLQWILVQSKAGAAGA
jgi:hypothetical protein